jgi:hypothetical protein
VGPHERATRFPPFPLCCPSRSSEAGFVTRVEPRSVWSDTGPDKRVCPAVRPLFLRFSSARLPRRPAPRRPMLLPPPRRTERDASQTTSVAGIAFSLRDRTDLPRAPLRRSARGLVPRESIGANVLRLRVGRRSPRDTDAAGRPRRSIAKVRTGSTDAVLRVAKGVAACTVFICPAPSSRKRGLCDGGDAVPGVAREPGAAHGSWPARVCSPASIMRAWMRGVFQCGELGLRAWPTNAVVRIAKGVAARAVLVGLASPSSRATENRRLRFCGTAAVSTAPLTPVEIAALQIFGHRRANLILGRERQPRGTTTWFGLRLGPTAVGTLKARSLVSGAAAGLASDGK